MKKLISSILCVMLVITMMPTMAFADGGIVEEGPREFYGYQKVGDSYVRMDNRPGDNTPGYPAYFAGANSAEEEDAFYVLWPKTESDEDTPELNVFEVEGWDNRPVNNETGDEDEDGGEGGSVERWLVYSDVKLDDLDDIDAARECLTDMLWLMPGEATTAYLYLADYVNCELEGNIEEVIVSADCFEYYHSITDESRTKGEDITIVKGDGTNEYHFTYTPVKDGDNPEYDLWVNIGGNEYFALVRIGEGSSGERWLVYSDVKLDDLDDVEEARKHLTDMLWLTPGEATTAYLYLADYVNCELEGNIEEVIVSAEYLKYYYSGAEGEDVTIVKGDDTNEYHFTYTLDKDGVNPEYDLFVYIGDNEYFALIRIGNSDEGEDEGSENNSEPAVLGMSVVSLAESESEPSGDGDSGDEGTVIPENEFGIYAVLQESTYTDENDVEYYVWKLIVDDDFDMAKVGITLSCVNDYTYVLWVLGEAYCEASDDFYDNGIYIVQEIPENNCWDSLDDVKTGDPKINLNLSETAGADRNTFYILTKDETSVALGLTKLHAFSLVNGSGLGGGGFRAEQVFDTASTLVVDENNVIDVTIEGEDYDAVPVHLDHYLGHSDLHITAVSGNSKLRARITFGMDIYFEGALAGIEKIGPVWNDTQRILGFGPISPDFEIVKAENGDIKAYFEDACAIITDKNQGSVCTVSIGLKDGYAITNIHDGENPFVFLADDSSLYNIWDADKNLLDSDKKLNDAGWEGPRSGGSDQEDGTHKTVAGTVHRIATYGIDGVGFENVSYLKSFLDENGFTAQKLGDFTDYNMYFDKAQYEGTNAAETIKIVFEVTRPENFKDGDLQIFGRNDIELDTKELGEEEYDAETYNSNVEQLYGEDNEVKTVYEITETKGQVAGNGIIGLAISETDLDGGNLEDYTVAYFTEDGIPVEVETTYVEDEGLVFTTGHFSKYAVIGKKLEGGDNTGGSDDNEGGSEGGGTTGGESGSGSGSGSGGGGGFIPSAPAANPLAEAKSEASKTVTAYVDQTQYDAEEADEIKAILEKAEADIKAAKTKEEIEAIEEAVKKELDKLETAEEKAVIAEVEKTKFKARSKMTTLKGKKAIKVYWNIPAGMEFDGFDVFRSTKKNSGYGKKPFYTAKSNYYINNKDLKSGKTYYYKVRAFKYVNDEKVYTKWSLKAWRTVK